MFESVAIGTTFYYNEDADNEAWLQKEFDILLIFSS